jgi:predicted Rossmann fold flavoprotein
MAKLKVAVIGAGAAGFFSSIHLSTDPRVEVHLLEQTKNVLSKVKISGGGRCNVTHNLLSVEQFCKKYPRGERELKWALMVFGPKETQSWFASKGVTLKAEADGRMFPTTNSSQTIIDCLLAEANNNGVILRTETSIESILPVSNSSGHLFCITYKDGCNETFDRILFASGSSRKTWNWIAGFGHSIIEPVPSIFTFQVQDNRLDGLSGVAFTEVETKLVDTKIKTDGALLITHWGLSGPSILRLSAWGSRALFECNYKATLEINFFPTHNIQTMKQELEQWKRENSKKTIGGYSFTLPKRYWERLLSVHQIPSEKQWSQISGKEMQAICEEFVSAKFTISVKGEFKEEFVTAGGVNRKEVNFSTMESKILKGIYFAGEVLDIDGITGGFNFQNAWTTGYIAANGILQSL